MSCRQVVMRDRFAVNSFTVIVTVTPGSERVTGRLLHPGHTSWPSAACLDLPVFSLSDCGFSSAGPQAIVLPQMPKIKEELLP